MRSSLYAYILAHIFVSELESSPAPPDVSAQIGKERLQKKRRDTPYWPSAGIPAKAADVLGIPGLGIAHLFEKGEEDGDSNGKWKERVDRLSARLRRSIRRLVEGMGGEVQEGELGMVVIKCLEEVVKGCEMDFWNGFEGNSL